MTLQRGHCSACGAPAERAPKGTWWHAHWSDCCGNRSMTIYQPVKWARTEDGRLSMGAASDKDLPARFVPEEK